MNNLWRDVRLSSFDRIDFKGLGRWILAAFILQFIVFRMSIHISGDTTEGFITITSGVPFYLCIGMYACVYNRLINLPQFARELPFTAKQEIKISVALLIQYFFAIVVFFGVLSIIGATVFTISGGNVFNGVHINLGKEIYNRAWSLFYYLIMGSLLFPLGLIRDKKKWYISFGMIAIAIAGMTLLLVNLLPGSKGFRTSGNMYEDAVKIPNYNLLLIIMGIICLLAIMISYKISQKLHAPKRYVEL